MRKRLSLLEVYSPIKWEQERKYWKIKKLADDRAALPILNREDIITYRLPFHEAVKRKLDKKGFKNSAEYVNQLIAFQDAYRDVAGEESIIWQRPRLIYQHDVLEHLAAHLSIAETAHYENNMEVEIDEILKMAVKFCFESENWWWLGHQLLFMVLKNSEIYQGDRGKRKAIVRYVFGRFLFQNAKEPEMALEHLNIARETSAGMLWDVNVLFPNEKNTIYADACKYIFKILILQAKAIMQKDPNTAMEITAIARTRAMDGCFYEGVIEGDLLKGNIRMVLNDTDEAIKHFLKGLQTLGEHADIDLKCEILRNLAAAYLKHGTLDSALQTLKTLKAFAQQHNRLLYVAEAHKYLGEFYLHEGTARYATPFLMTAVELFNKVGARAETAKTRNLAAISVGIELMPTYSELLRNSDRKFSDNYAEALKALISWKGSRILFWVKDTRTSLATMVSEHMVNTMKEGSEQNITSQNLLDMEEILGLTGFDDISIDLSTNSAHDGNMIKPFNPDETSALYLDRTKHPSTSNCEPFGTDATSGYSEISTEYSNTLY